MKQILGCRISETVYEGNVSTVYRGTLETSGERVIIKLLKGEHPGALAIAHFRREYEILKKADLSCVVKLISWGSVNNSYAMIMEDFGGDSVKRILVKKSLNLKQFIELFIEFAKILDQLHAANIIHLNVNPSNFVWNPADNQLKIIDFGLASEGRRTGIIQKDTGLLESTLGYISPEQTGRMNRMIDYRSDFYSLGVTCYEMMTGQLPFHAEEALDLIHCHIAKMPVPPHHLDTVIDTGKPEEVEILSKIILKLLSKNAEERYLSAAGLIHDLEKCLEVFNERQTLSGFDFELGQQDFSDTFQIPQKLYGRENEIQILKEAFYRVRSSLQEGLTCELLMVNGSAGIGKSALVNEIHKYLGEMKGYLISGKFDRISNIPYSPLIQAFQDIIRQILTENNEKVTQWKEKILEAVGPNGQVIVDVIPELEMIIGEQPPVPELPPAETQNRFNSYFKNFVLAFAREQHPLSIFLDNLQWTDIPTLKFLESLVLDSQANYLLIIGAYRNNEVNSSHPVSEFIDNLHRKHASVRLISLSPLKIDHVHDLLSDSLKRKIDETEKLARLCLEKTNGNPFFLRQFLYSLAEDKFIEFDPAAQRWTWDLEAIISKGITSNVAELLTCKIMNLPEQSKRAIQLAACIGTRFDLGTLSIIYERSPEETESALRQVLDAGLVQPLDERYRDVTNLNFLKNIESFDKLEFRIQYQFIHDRVQQAAYSLIGQENKRIHKQIGQLLLEKLEEGERDEKIFEIVDHLNAAIDLITDKSEKEILARLNFKAGKKAKSATAYEIAYKYLLTGIALLDESCWDEQYSLAFDMYTESAEVSCLTGQFAMMEDLTGTAMNHSAELLDHVRIYEVIIQAYMARARLREGVRAAIEILGQLGVHIPQNPNKITVLLKILQLRLRMAGKSQSDLEGLPQMSDPYKLAAMRILMNAASATYYGNVLTSITIALKMVRISVRYGNAPCSPYGFSMYAIVLIGILRDISRGYQLGRFSSELLFRNKSREYYAKIYVLNNIFIRHWQDNLSETVEPLADAYLRGIETGDYEYASYSAAYSCIHAMLSGTNLEIVDREMRKNIDIVNKLNQEIMLYILKIISQVSLNLSGKSAHRTSLIGEQFNEEEDVPQIIEDNVITFLGILFTMKSLLCYLFEEKESALKNVQKAGKYRDTLIGLYYTPLLCFYSSLIYLDSYRNANWFQKLVYAQRIWLNQKRLKRFARYAPGNHQHKYFLVEAERAGISGNIAKAMMNYDRAIALARENGYIQEEALSSELAAKYYLRRGNERIASAYMREAYYLYTKWGAGAKVEQLTEKYPEMVGLHGRKGIHDESGRSFPELTPSMLDVDSIQKASQILSQEIHLDRLLEKLLRIVITSAGARRGFIMLREKEGLYIEGEASVEKDQITVMEHIPVNEYRDVAKMIINYVTRTKETVVLDDAAREGDFVSDEFIERVRSRSIFCMPLISKMELNGILYLENDLVSGSFTPRRTEIMKTLAGQFMISIENARLYRNLEEYNSLLELRVKERTLKLKEMNVSLTNSISYASKIQSAILPPDESLKKLLHDHFILYKPLEVVSGDFYWLTQIKETIIIAVADCTGHGVSGAFMSILGIALLNDIINKMETIHSATILNELRKQLINSLHQTGKHDEAREGMDIAVCLLDKDFRSLEYAGAHHPLYVLRRGEIIELKPDMMTIGITSETDESFSSHTLSLQNDDTIYLFSDGYTDQFGGEKRKRFKSTRLKQVLQEIQDKKMTEQKVILERTLNEWMRPEGQYGEEYEQIDDILVMGIKINSLD